MAEKRLQALMQKEMIEHQHIISSHHKEMQSLRDSLKIAMERFDSLFNHCESVIQDHTASHNEEISKLQEKIKNHEVMISEQKKTILSLYQEINDFHQSHASKKDIENHRKEMANRSNETMIHHLNSIQSLQQDMKSLFQTLSEELKQLKLDFFRDYDSLKASIDDRFSLSKMDKDGVLKEIRVYYKTIFIIEKKIEHLYILIERINQRGEVCPKQD